MDKFWRWVVNETGEGTARTLHMEGYIAESSWFDDDITPKQFKAELYGEGEMADDIIVKIHSPGGDTFAAAQIYNMLMEYPGNISVQVDGLAASAASVIAMAGDEVCVSPLSVIMIHNPAMLIAGEVADLEVGSMSTLLEKVKANLILDHDADDTLIEGLVNAAVSYAESFQHLDEGYYTENPMSPATEQGIIMLASHFYESRDGSTGGFFNDDVRASEQVWKTVHLLLRMGREWKI